MKYKQRFSWEMRLSGEIAPNWLNACSRWHFYRLLKHLNQVAFLSSWLECLTWQTLYWRVCRFDPFSSLFTPKWYEWVWYEFSWWNDMKWHIKWYDVWCNTWNARCSRNTKCATCVMCVRCVWCVQWNIWNMTWNDVKCNMKWREMMHEMTCGMQCIQCRSFISVTCNEM